MHSSLEIDQNTAARSHPLLTAALLHYRPQIVVSVVNGPPADPAVAGALERLCPDSTLVTIVDHETESWRRVYSPPWDRGFSPAPQFGRRSAWSGLSALRGVVDVLHLRRPKPTAMERYFPFLSRSGVVVTDEEGEAGSIVESVTEFADRYDLIAIRQLGKIAISPVDVVALLGLTATGAFSRATTPPLY